MIFEKSYIENDKDFNPEKSMVIEKNNDYTMIISKDLDNALAGKKATDEYIQLQIYNKDLKEIIGRIEFEKEKE
jgi:hypothetical protein